ncbi:MAG: hypothetical protein P8O07_04320 [Crocinitomicaceae bacterium]|nr:hypothetical protein [Crocinitomicaceae bacterium]
MKKLVVVLAVAVSGILFAQDDPILSESQLYDALHADDIPGYTKLSGFLDLNPLL